MCKINHVKGDQTQHELTKISLTVRMISNEFNLNHQTILIFTKLVPKQLTELLNYSPDRAHFHDNFLVPKIKSNFQIVGNIQKVATKKLKSVLDFQHCFQEREQHLAHCVEGLPLEVSHLFSNCHCFGFAFGWFSYLSSTGFF